jgi:hypothetical protein
MVTQAKIIFILLIGIKAKIIYITTQKALTISLTVKTQKLKVFYG